MTDLTVVILTKNEEKNLRKCVESFCGVAKRFVIVDSFSTDGTEALCKELNAELQKIGSALDFYQNKWVSYADQLNWGLQNTGIDTEWSMRMDADEEIMENLATEIDEKLPNVREPVNGIILRRRVYFMGRWIKHGGRYPELLLRIFRTGKASCEMKIMDEHMILSEGTTVEFKHDLIDNNQKDLEWWTAKHNWYSNREVLDHQMTLENAMDETIMDLLFPVPVLIALFCGVTSPYILIACVVLGYAIKSVALVGGLKIVGFVPKLDFYWNNPKIKSFFLLMPPMSDVAI